MAINSIWGNGYSNNYLYNNTTSSFGGTGNLLGIDFGEYASITKGSYRKLIKAYYDKYGKDGEPKTSKEESSKEAIAAKNSLKEYADSLYKSIDALTVTGKKSLFNKVELTDEETGKKSMGYDTDKIYKAVNDFVEAYNNYVKKAVDSEDNAILRQTLGMTRAAATNSGLLSKIGIKIGADNTLKIDEEAFKKADMAAVQSIFSGSGSFGNQVQTAANKVYLNINNSLGNKGYYTSSGVLGNYSSGDILDSLL